MFKYLTISLMTAFLISGCATAPVSPKLATEIPPIRIINSMYLVREGNSTSSLTFVRDSGLYGVGVTIYLYINGKKIAGFRPMEKLQLFLKPGEYLIGVRSIPNFGLEQFIESPFRIEPSQEYSYRIGIDYNKAIVQRTSAF